VKRLLAVIAIAAATVPLLAVPAAHAGLGCHSTSARDARGVRVDVVDVCFDPVVIRIQPGQRVRWTNKDPFPHNVFGVGGKWGDVRELAQGQSVSERFAASGVYPYICILHPGMAGVVVVGDGTSRLTEIDSAAVTTVPETPAAPPAAPAAAAPAATAPVTADSNTGPVIAALLALSASVLIGSVVLLARRTPAAQPHPQV
jgi:plastocyanin